MDKHGQRVTKNLEEILLGLCLSVSIRVHPWPLHFCSSLAKSLDPVRNKSGQPAPMTIQKSVRRTWISNTAIPMARPDIQVLPMKRSTQLGGLISAGISGRQDGQSRGTELENTCASPPPGDSSRPASSRRIKTVDERDGCGHQKKKARPAGHQPHSDGQQNVSQVERVADAAVRPIGHQAVRVQFTVMDHRAVQVGLGPRPHQRRQGDEQDAHRENRPYPDAPPAANAEPPRIMRATATDTFMRSHV